MNSNGSQRKLIWVSTILVLVLMRLTSESAELKGTVIAVQGDDVTVKVESAGALQPAVGDILNIMERANEEGNALGIPGKWIITEVIGDIVKAEGENLLKGLRPKVNMQAFIHIPPGSVHAGEVPADVEKKSHPAAKGKVIMTKGKDVTIQLDKGQPTVSKGDVVELSFTAGGEVIPVGKWRVSVVKENGNVEAKPFEPKGEPNIDMDALVFTSTLEKSESVKSKKVPLKSDNLSTAKDLYKRLMALIDGTDPSRKEIFERARDEDPTAQNQVGAYFYDGDGVPQSYEEAAKWYRLAAEQDEPWAMTNLAVLYERGYGVDQDLDQAVAWNRRGADQGFANGQRYLGYMYQRGLGVPRDYTEAVRLYRLSAAQNYGPAHNDLGIMYQQGWGVQQDHAQAVIWFRSAANLKNDWGYKNLAMHFEKGLGVPANRDLAIQNYKAAARMGNAKAQDWLRNQGLNWQ